jgi:transcriptional antiterminator RfaH
MEPVEMEYWYALYTKPRKEYQVRALLESQGIEAYLPTIRRQVRRRDRPETKVYFPCYLFARLDFDVTPRSSIAWMPGVRRIVSTGEQPTIVAEEIVDLVRHRLHGAMEVGYGDLKHGDKVRITSGPLKDLDAVFDQPLPAAQRVRILLEVMGRMRMTPVDLDPAHIRRVE